VILNKSSEIELEHRYSSQTIQYLDFYRELR